MNNKPEVSFVIRTKDEEKFIGKVLILLQKQTFKNFEIIIVDSGSTDKTLEIVNKFPVRLFKINQKDFNYSFALNFGIKNALGKYICIISGHSIPISNTWLTDGVDVMQDKNIAGISGYWTDFILGYYSRLLGRVFFILPYFKFRTDHDVWLTNTNSLIKKEFWEKYHFDEKLEGSEDYDWAKEMISRGYNILKYRPFSVFHSHFMVGKPGYFASLSIWKKWNEIVDNKPRPSTIKI